MTISGASMDARAGPSFAAHGGVRQCKLNDLQSRDDMNAIVNAVIMPCWCAALSRGSSDLSGECRMRRAPRTIVCCESSHRAWPREVAPADAASVEKEP